MTKINIKELPPKKASYKDVISDRLLDELQQGIIEVLFLQRKYKDKTFTARELARILNTNTRYVSAAISKRFHMNYTSLVNKQRVDEAMNLLSDRRYSDLNVEEISDMVGFSHRQSFYNAFVRITGMTPREFQKKKFNIEN